MPHVHASVSVTTEPTTADVLRDARDLLLPPERWMQGHLDNSHETPDEQPTCFCIVGAITRVSPGVVSTCAAIGVVVSVIEDDPRSAPQPRKPARIPCFNDHPDTRHVDILDALDRAVSAAVLAETK